MKEADFLLMQEHKIRWDIAKQKRVRFMLFDIDHNITNSAGCVPEFMIKLLAKLVNEKKIGIGFVSGRPEKTSLGHGQDIRSVLDDLVAHIHSHNLKNIMIFPEYAGYALNVGTKAKYSYGFISIFNKYKQQILNEWNKRKYDWCDLIEHKHTSFSFWIKEALRKPQCLLKFQNEMQEILSELKLDEIFVAINGANRTIDILSKNVNKALSITEIAKIYNISKHEIATSDDQAGKNEAGFLFTNHDLGFATKSFNEESSGQISTFLALGLTGIDAVALTLNTLNFEPLNPETANRKTYGDIE